MCPPQPAQSFFEQKKYWGIPFKVEPEASSYPLGRLNCDPPVALLRSVMEHMAHVAAEMTKKGPGRPDFVLFTGGLVGWMLPPPLLATFTFQNLNHNKRLISQQRSTWQFWSCVSPYLLIFFVSRNLFVCPTVWGDIPSHQLSCQYHQARIIELVAGRREFFGFFSVALRDVGWCREIGRCLVLSTMFVVSWYFVSSGQSIWLAGKSTSFWENIGFLRLMFWSSKIK